MKEWSIWIIIEEKTRERKKGWRVRRKEKKIYKSRDKEWRDEEIK